MKEINEIVNDFNEGWIHGNYDLLSDILHEEVVFFTPDRKIEIIGKEPCLKSIKEYNKNATTNKFEIRHQNVYTSGNTATVMLKYWVDYDLNDENHTELGSEWWMLSIIEGKWQIISRAMVGNEPSK